MEKNGGSRIIAIVALVIAVAGLSLGFAAYSSTFEIGTNATVKSDANWKVGFSTNNTTIQDRLTSNTINGVNSDNSLAGGSVDVTKYTISQTANANAVLKTQNGSYVTYTLNMLNEGTLPAYLDSVNFTNMSITCTNVTSSDTVLIEEKATGGAGTNKIGGNSSNISSSDCETMFNVSLQLGSGEPYTPSSSSFSGTIPAKSGNTPGNIPVVLKLAYAGTSAADAIAAGLDGDIVVSVGPITVVYTSTNPSNS